MEHGEQQREILLIALRAGQILLENGAEIFRVEDTVYRICHHYGLTSASAFVLSNGIFLTAGSEEETQFAKVLQMPVNNTNLNRVAELNQLSRQIEAGVYTLAEVKQQLQRIEQLPEFPKIVQVGAAAAAAACFCQMFGGNLRDGICSFVIGALLYLYILYIGKPHFSRIVCSIAGSAWVTFLCIFFYRLGLGTHLEAMMIGGIILMVPGVAFTNAIRDVADEDYISGSVRMMDAMLGFFCIALGVGVMMSVYGTIAGGVLL